MKWIFGRKEETNQFYKDVFRMRKENQLLEREIRVLGHMS
jgi:hypothetical protein